MASDVHELDNHNFFIQKRQEFLLKDKLIKQNIKELRYHEFSEQDIKDLCRHVNLISHKYTCTSNINLKLKIVIWIKRICDFIVYPFLKLFFNQQKVINNYVLHLTINYLHLQEQMQILQNEITELKKLLKG